MSHYNTLDFTDISFAQQIAAFTRTNCNPNMKIDTHFYQDPRAQQTFCPNTCTSLPGGSCPQKNSLFADINTPMKDHGMPQSPWQALTTAPQIPHGLRRDESENWPLSGPGTIVGMMTHVPGRKL